MATRGILYAVFLLPVLFSAVFGTAVMADILQKPDRELNMWNFGEHDANKHAESIEIMGIEKQYSVSEPISFNVKVHDSAFDCGDLYVTIYSDDQSVLVQHGFFDQCFDQDNRTLPINEKFFEIIDTPGTFDAVVELYDVSQQAVLTITERFTVK